MILRLMMPILPLVRVPNVDKFNKIAKDIETIIFVKNGPS